MLGLLATVAQQAAARRRTRARQSNLETGSDPHATAAAHGNGGPFKEGNRTAVGTLASSASGSEQRPKSLTPAIETAILDGIRQGIPAGTAARLAGIPGRTWDGWQQIMAGRSEWYSGEMVSEPLRTFLAALAERIAAARAEFEAQQVQLVALAAQERNERTGQRDWRASAWLLNNHPAYRQAYREYRELHVEQQGALSVEHRLVRQLPLADVLELAGPEFRDLLPAPLEGG